MYSSKTKRSQKRIVCFGWIFLDEPRYVLAQLPPPIYLFLSVLRLYTYTTSNG